MAENSEGAAMAGARARFALFLDSLSRRAAPAPTGELAALLGTFAATVAETHPDEGAILRRWAVVISGSAQH